MTSLPGREPAAIRTTPAETAAPGLRRGALNLRETIVGTLANLAPAEGIFLSVTLVVGAMGARAPWAFAIAAVAILAAGNTMAEFAKVMPSAGSFVTFISNGFGVSSRRTGTVLGGVAFYLLLLCYPITIAAVVVFLGSWVAQVFNWTAGYAWLVVTLVSIAAVLPFLLRGVVISTMASFVLFTTEVVGLVVLSSGVLALAGARLDAPLHDSGGAPGGFGGLVGITFALAVSGFIGWENSGALAEESSNPRRFIPITIFSSVLVVGAIYLLSTWAAVAGFVGWQGPVKGIGQLGNVNEAAPFLDLAKHYMPWFAWAIALIGFTSALACFLAAANSQTRIIFIGAREGLLPAVVSRVGTTTRVPYVAVGVYVALTVLLCVVPFFWANSNPVAIFSDEAGIGTVPILLVYLMATIALPVYMLRARRDLFNPLRHLVVPLIGIAVLAYGIFEFVQPNQPAPGATFWLYILALLVISVVWTLATLARNPSAIARVGSVLAE